jgi:L-ascorbate metabolism protein UlaG (beta-lactamase superfamily)
MKITRTANAGVLLELDGVSILMDGVCREVKPYPATPPEVKRTLMEHFPDVVAFTHAHKDHYDPDYAAEYEKQTGGVVLGPEDLPRCSAVMQPCTVGAVTVTPVSSRHIGAAGKTTSHASFVVSGSRCVWFTGDAAPTQWRQCDLPKPDVLFVPYAYATTQASWALTQSLGASKIILVHMPDREEDTIGLWDAVKSTVGNDEIMCIPEMGQQLLLE